MQIHLISNPKAKIERGHDSIPNKSQKTKNVQLWKISFFKNNKNFFKNFRQQRNFDKKSSEIFKIFLKRFVCDWIWSANSDFEFKKFAPARNKFVKKQQNFAARKKRRLFSFFVFSAKFKHFADLESFRSQYLEAVYQGANRGEKKRVSLVLLCFYCDDGWVSCRAFGDVCV